VKVESGAWREGLARFEPLEAMSFDHAWTTDAQGVASYYASVSSMAALSEDERRAFRVRLLASIPDVAHRLELTARVYRGRRPDPEVRIRAAKPDDTVAIASIYLAAAQEAWGHIFGASNLRQLDPPVERFRDRICASPSHEDVLVIELNGRVRGFAVVRPCADDDADPTRVGELDMIYTDPALWGQGIGRRLLVAASAGLQARGFVEATLWTAEENLRPRRVYEAAGWIPDGSSRSRSWLGVEFRELRYRVALTQARG